MEFVRIIDGISGAEGPVFDLNGRMFMVEPNRGRVLEITSDGVAREHAHTGAVPAGLQVDRNNDLWCADMKRGILRISSEGKVFDEVTAFEGKPIRGCNDCYFDSRGNLYFTAPAGSDETTPVGQVFCRLADGDVLELARDFRFSNGLAVNSDDSQLIVAETYTRLLWQFDLSEPGRASSRKVFGELPAGDTLGPDGMDFDIDGRLLVANFGGGSIDVFDANGTLLERVHTPFAKVTNVHFAGPQSTTLLITECTNHALWKTSWRTTGQLQYCDAARTKHA